MTTQPTPRGGSETFGAFAEKFLTSLQAAEKRSFRLREIHWRIYAGPWLGDLTFRQLNQRGPELLADWIAMLVGMRVRYGLRRRARASIGAPVGTKRLSAHYVVGIFSTVRLLVRRAVLAGHLSRNVADDVRGLLPKRVSEKSIRRLDRASMVRLCTADGVPVRDRVEYLFALLACARVGEVYALRWSDLHLDAPIPLVTIARTLDDAGERRTKTEEARDVPLHPALVAALLEWRASGHRSYAGDDPTRDGHVFPHGCQRTYRGSSIALRAVCARLKLPLLRYHELRHTGASAYRSAGVPYEDVAAILGHRVPGMTAIYARPSLEHLASMVAKLHLDFGAVPRSVETAGKKEVDRGSSSGARLLDVTHPNDCAALELVGTSSYQSSVIHIATSAPKSALAVTPDPDSLAASIAAAWSVIGDDGS